MQLERVVLRNFRGFEEVAIDFHGRFTVLLGANMAGKTAVLEGAAVGLAKLTEGVDGAQQRIIEGRDVRTVVHEVNGAVEEARKWPVMVQVVARSERLLNGVQTWTRERKLMSLDDTPLHGLRDVAGLDKAIDLPVVAHYGPQRFWRPAATPDVRRVGARIDAYASCFDIRWTDGMLADWIRKQTLIQLQHGKANRQFQLAAVEHAVLACIEGVQRFWYDLEYEELRIERAGENLSFSMLSEGYRNMVAMVADIAWRAAVLNPHHRAEAHQRAEGVVLIDELELHLHPKWQRTIVADLQRTFPRMQFIVTTHSPQIVASVSQDQVRLLDQNRLVSTRLHVEGRDANQILEDIFGVPRRPDATAQAIHELYELIDAEDFVGARVSLARLEAQLGVDDAEIVRARWILDTEEDAGEHRPAVPPHS